MGGMELFLKLHFRPDASPKISKIDFTVTTLRLVASRKIITASA
jgi:hypothetical protein